MQDVTCILVQEIGQQAAHDSLVANDQNVALPLQLHDDWLQSLNQVLVGLDRTHTSSLRTRICLFLSLLVLILFQSKRMFSQHLTVVLLLSRTI